MNRPHILVVDDDESIRDYLAELLSSWGYSVECVSSGERAISRLRAPDGPAVLILDLKMPGVGGLEVLNEMTRLGQNIPTIVLSVIGQVKTVVKAVKLGAVDYLVKPFEDSELKRAIRDALDQNSRGDVTTGLDRKLGEMFSRSECMRRIHETAAQVADTDVPILILGESGVGKEVLARFIHARSTRRDEPFIKVNCAALPADLLESELFGYERGAFTGALREKPGKFELAGTGSILLDEIGEMSPLLQAKLLHVLQDGEYARLGGGKPLRARARVLAATNRRPEEMLADRTFREDLYYRLNVIHLEVPPLRERREEILPLSQWFLELYRTKYKRPELTLPPELTSAFERYSWPGNVRQLENIIKRYVILPDLDLILADLQEPSVTPPVAEDRTPFADLSAAREPSTPHDPSLKEVSAMAAERAEKEVVLRMLEEVNWNRKQAARRLSISYKALLNKLNRWNIGGRAKSTNSGS